MTTQHEIDELQLQLSNIEDRLLNVSRKPQKDEEALVEYQAQKILELEQENEELRLNFKNLRKTYGSVLKQLKDEIKDLTIRFSAFEENLEDSQVRSQLSLVEQAESKRESDQLVIKSLLQSIGELEDEKEREESPVAVIGDKRRLYYGLNDRNQQLAKNIEDRLNSQRGSQAPSDGKSTHVLQKLMQVEKQLSQIDQRVEGLENSLAESLSG